LCGAEIGGFGKEIRNTWKVFKCGTGKWRRSVVPTVRKLKKYCMASRRKAIFCIQYNEGKVSKLVTSCVTNAFWNALLNER
jgi:hypothetical protein